jgi:hypothetical protein
MIAPTKNRLYQFAVWLFIAYCLSAIGRIRHVIFYLLIGGLPTAACFSQDFNPPEPKKEKEKKPFWSWDKVYGGGGIGLSFGNRITFINLSPQVGYKITEKYSAGFGITYIYVQDRGFTPAYSLNIFGGNIFNRYLITNFLFAHAEYEIINGPWNLPYSNKRFNLYNVWLGGGLRQSAGHSSLNIVALWNLNETFYSRMYFPSPQIRIGINIGI